jgi:hypothetical protein
MKLTLHFFRHFKRKRVWMSLLAFLLFFVLVLSDKIYSSFFEAYTGVTNARLTFDTSQKLTVDEFEKLGKELIHKERMATAEKILAKETNEFTKEVKLKMLLNTRSFQEATGFKHIDYFRKANILQYEGPETCQQCHKTMSVKTHEGHRKEVDTLEDVVNTVHFQFQSTSAGYTTYGYDGRQVNTESRAVPVGKIDRACGIPGSFSWTGWAALVKTKPHHANGEVELRSEGCGQCHIGGNYHPATEKMMPVGDVPYVAKQGIDCLICHSQAYDMNYKYVIEDKNGTRWNQDRTLKAAMAVTNPQNENCLNCHQHNMGGDAYSDNISAKSLGYKNKRLLHEGAKRGNPFSYKDDVHYRAGIQCTDCHKPEGHKIPRGNLGTDLVANDLPGVEVSCENCHTTAPHTKVKDRVILNGHIARVACETCHITNLEHRNVVLRDWVNAKFNEEEGIYTPQDIYRSGDTGKGFAYLWYNGNGTFLANAIGGNPDGSKGYNPLMNDLTKIVDPNLQKEIAENAKQIIQEKGLDEKQYLTAVFDTLSQMNPAMKEKRAEMIEKNLRKIMERPTSKLYPFKLFNAYMYEDLNNEGPFGAMILPFDYATYYETGDTLKAVVVATNHPIVKRMYEAPFKYYMMDEFMKYFGVDEWKTIFPFDKDGKPKNVKPRWMRQMGTLMVNHGIGKAAWSCKDCHSNTGIIDFEALGYSKARIQDLRNLKELK